MERTSAGADVVIVGAGIIGASCAFNLARAGYRVRVVEAGGWAAGASGSGQGALIASDHSTEAARDLAKAGIRLWPELSAVTSQAEISADYASPGSLLVVVDERQAASAEARRIEAARSGIRVEWITCDELRHCEPEINHSAVGALLFPDDGLVEPRKATVAILRAAVDLGAMAAFHVAARTITDCGSHLVVRTDRESYSAQWVVIAAGLATAQIIRSIGQRLPMSPTAGQVAVVLHPVLRVSRFVTQPVLHSDATLGDAMAWGSVQPAGAGTFLVGGCRQPSPGAERRVDWERARVMLSRASYLVPRLQEGSIIRLYSGIRPGSPDGTPYIGPIPGHERIIVATGHGGAGIMMAPATGALVHALVSGTEGPVPVGPYALDRLAAESMTQ